jgi:hypothetical protein
VSPLITHGGDIIERFGVSLTVEMGEVVEGTPTAG